MTCTLSPKIHSIMKRSHLFDILCTLRLACIHGEVREHMRESVNQSERKNRGRSCQKEYQRNAKRPEPSIDSDNSAVYNSLRMIYGDTSQSYK